MLRRALAFGLLAALACGRGATHDAAPASKPPQPAAAHAPSAAPAQPVVAAAPVASPRPPAFLPFAVQCGSGYERLAGTCVHAGYMRRTPLTQLMNELIAYRNGTPAPSVEPEPPSDATQAPVVLEGARRRIDPSTLDPGALMAKPEDIAERERNVLEAAHNRGELSANARSPRGAPLPPSREPPELPPPAAGGDTQYGTVDGQRTELPKYRGSSSTYTDEEKAGAQRIVEKLQQQAFEAADCTDARASIEEARRTNCYMAPADEARCAQLLPQLQSAADLICSLVK